MSALALMLTAWLIEAVFGWPKCLYDHIKHPVVWLGSLINALNRLLNRTPWPHHMRYVAGIVSSLIVISVFVAPFWLISDVMPNTWLGFGVEALIASSLIASRSLYDHVADVAAPLVLGDIDKARSAVSLIVGRDPEYLNSAGIARAGLESLAENTSDGVTAPIFWGVILGLPGLAGYKAINTLDSMVGHKNEQFAAFGGFAARVDDLANFIPARLTGFLFVLVSLRFSAFGVMFKDAGNHRSLNAGWPEAAMAGSLGVRLSGPRAYGGQTGRDQWLNEGAPDPSADDLSLGLNLYLRALLLGLLSLVIGVLALEGV